LLQASLTLGNPDLINGTGVAVMHYLRSLTRSVALGAELAYQSSPQLPGGHVAVLSVAARHSGENHALAATVGNGGQVHATYYQRCSDTLQLGVELETSFKSQEATAAIGYEVELAKGSFLARGSVDSNLIVKSVIEKKLQPLPFTLALCSLINHRKNQYQFGCGLIIG
jgi:mitochondrial import receptor subunit TOM40